MLDRLAHYYSQAAASSPWAIRAAVTVTGAAALLIVVYLWLVPNSIMDARRRKLPPGPRGLPVIGNMFDLADSDAVQHVVRKWHQEHGDFFYTKIGATDYFWLSSPKVVKDLMDKKSNIYSSRPPLPLAQDVASAGRRQLFMPYGPQWRSLRKHSHALLNLNASIKYQPVQDFESKQVLRDLLESPNEFYDINRRYATSVIMLVAYGHRVASFEDPLMKKIFTVLDHLTEITAPGAFAVDSFPSLSALPESLLGNWRSLGRQYFQHDSKVYLDLWNQLKRDVDAGTARDSFCKQFYLNKPHENGIDEMLAAYTCGGLIEAGSETTATTINNWFLAMALFPEARAAAQEEIDRVVGPDRLPTWEDEKNLPYVRAMVKEVLRWRPVNKFGMMHATSEDDWYNGFFIPKGSVAVLNWWAIHRDPTIFPNPDTFDPRRYLAHPLPAADYINTADPYQRDHFTYGAGRRVCPGVHVAERSLYINIVRVLWGFDIGKAKNGDGQVVEPSTEMVRGFLSVPVRFRCSVAPRSARHAQLMRDVFEQAEREGL